MKAVVCGSRDATSQEVVFEFLDSIHAVTPIELVIEGGQRKWKDRKIVGGVDWFANQWAKARGIEVKTVEADWNDMSPPCRLGFKHGGAKYNKDAVKKRDQKIFEEMNPDVVIDLVGGAVTGGTVFLAHCHGVRVIEASYDQMKGAWGKW